MAGLDTTIPLGIKPVDFGDPNEGRMNALRAQLLQMQMQQGQFNMMKAQRDMQYQDQQRAQAAAAAAAQKAKDEAMRRDFMAAYNATGNVNVPIPAQVAEPGAASDVGMLGSQNAMAEYKPTSMAMTQPKDLGAATNALIQGGKFDAATLGMGYNKAITEAEKKKVELGKAKSDAVTADVNAIDKTLGIYRQHAATINSPDAAANYSNAMYDNPVLGDMMRRMGLTKEQAAAKAASDYAADPQRWVAAHVGLTGEQVMSALQPKETEKIPELKKGEVWNPEAKRVEAVPGSSEYVAQTQKHEKDYKGLLNVENSTKGAEALISNILAPENKAGLENSFGGYSAYATQHASGNTAKVQALLDQLKSVFKQGGLKEFRQGGSIGAMTEKEWPIVADMIGKISPKMDVEDVKAALQNALNKIRSVKEVEREAYDTTWGKTQYHKPTGNAAPAVGANPHASKTDEQIKKELGL